MNPELGEPLSAPFHDFYASDKLLAVVSDIPQVPKEDLAMELLNMLINPLTDFDLEWHRDTIPPESTPASFTSFTPLAVFVRGTALHMKIDN